MQAGAAGTVGMQYFPRPMAIVTFARHYSRSVASRAFNSLGDSPTTVTKIARLHWHRVLPDHG
jgi:hypothetical protein